MSSLDSLVTAWIGKPDKIQSQDPDDVLRYFLQEMAALDQQSPGRAPIASVATTPTLSKRPALEPATPIAKKSRKTLTRATAPAAADKTPATRWQRRKRELETLKERVETLSNYATFLQTRQVPGLLKDAVHLPPELEQLLQIQTTGWQATAIKEIRCCQAAQQENAALKQRLQGCVQGSGMLQTALQEADKLGTELLVRGSIASRALQVELMLSHQYREADSAGVFDMLEQSVNAREHETQVVLRQAAQPVVTANTERVSICRRDEVHAAVEFKSVRVLPFDVDTVSTECWKIAELGWKMQGHRVVRRSKDVISSDWCFPVELDNGESVEIRVRSVAKRFVVPEGTVVLAESMTEWPAHLAASGIWSRVTRESGWGLVHAYPSNGSAARDPSPVSVSRLMIHLTNEPSGLGSDASRRLLGSPAVNDIVISSFRTLIQNRQQCVDNRLMDAAFAQGRSTVSAI